VEKQRQQMLFVATLFLASAQESTVFEFSTVVHICQTDILR